ncbi:MAG: bifunctional UDP-N-acetylglucosamine diphosphorylase/glucosamine-1-phosphate N-acetyltransferase GlmU [Pseudomonadota bacterium]
MSNLGVVILAAGQSKRLKSKISKVRHELAGRPVVSYPIEIAKKLTKDQIYVVISPGQSELENIIQSLEAKVAIQEKPLGTAHAVMQTEKQLSSFSGHILILCGDVPLIRLETLQVLVNKTIKNKSSCGVLTFAIPEPGHYGRIVRNGEGKIIKIVEAKDASPEELETKEVNSGIYCVEKDWLFETLKNIKADNHQKEFYLTDIIEIAIQQNRHPLAILADDPHELLGINSRADLAQVASAMRNRINSWHMANGVSIIAPDQTYIDYDVKIENDVTIWPGTFILGKTTIDQDCVIENGVVIKNSQLAKNVQVKSHSVLENCTVGAESLVGPFARLRPETKLGKKVRVGNFVEIKKSEIQDGSKANHLTYIGDSKIGSQVNVGAGTITCNYDGANKHLTVIEDDVFVGSDVQFIAPVKIGKGATIGAGSTITEDVPPNTLALSRSKQTLKKDWKRPQKKK